MSGKRIVFNGLSGCPCCGGVPMMRVFRTEQLWKARVECLMCGLRTRKYAVDPVATPEEAAAHFWNRRAPQQSEQTKEVVHEEI